MLNQALTADFALDQLSQLRGRRILFVMGSITTKLPMYQRVRELGVKAVILDTPGHWAQALVDEGFFEAFIEADISSDTCFEEAMIAIRRSGLHFDGVATFDQFATTLTAQIADALGLPGYPVQSVVIARNKYATRQHCTDAGLVTPRFARICSSDDLKTAAAEVGFPAVLKPANGAGSVDVFRVDNLHDLMARYQQIVTLNSSLPYKRGFDSTAEIEFVWMGGFEMVLEEFLDGDEFDVDCLLSQGEMVYFSVTSENPQPYMVETGAHLPAIYPEDKQAELVAMVREVLAAMNFTDGAFHVEAKYTSRGPRLIEVNTRLPGGFLYQMHKMVWGVDLVEHYLLTCLGLPIYPQKAAEPLNHLAYYSLGVPYSGIVTRDDFLAHLENDPRVILCETFVTTGEVVTGPEDGVPGWLGEIIVRGDSASEAKQTIDAILSEIETPILRREHSEKA